ncbi:small ribosomal subunit protein mS37-like [Corticium candelabrum]|uniref:small ribosomal subunit protein mS37-like n=1 Tax=Corticium candelabrum TaxID=121492 RepID=UPI002E261F13|nr:small ribosomal subunit protein mS37-like [Corticium candelabrum]
MVRQGLVLLKQRGLGHRRPLKLKNSVSHGKKAVNRAQCVPEMTSLMACWRSTKFNDESCRKEIEMFIKCAEEAEGARQVQSREKVVTRDHFGYWPPDVVNKMLKKIPRPY